MTRQSIAFVSISVFLFITPLKVAAEDFIEWHTSNVQILKGWDYEVGEEDRSILTFEHANGWVYGDFFMFIDFTRYDEGGTNAYAEFSPRLSFSKIFGNDISFGPVKDVLLSSTLEKGINDNRAYLYGAAINLDIPGFSFLTVNAYVRDNPEISGKGWQSTIAWKRPFKIGGLSFVNEGFADIAGDEGDSYHRNQLIVPRLLLDVGKLASLDEGRFFAGIEWQYWHNKFGIEGKTESVPQLQIKWVFD